MLTNEEGPLVCMCRQSCSSICSPQASPAFTKPFSWWPRKGWPRPKQNKRKTLLPESLCLSGDSCADFSVIPRPSQEKGCLLTAELRTGLLSSGYDAAEGRWKLWSHGSSASEILPSVPGAPSRVLQVHSSLISLFLKCIFLGALISFILSL